VRDEQVLAQSKAAYNQWAPQWREHAKIHAEFPQKSLSDFNSTGVGKAVLAIANGYSLEENIQTIFENQKNVDIICCDKTLGHLLSHGITPKFCLVADANVSYEKYLKPFENELEDTILLMNACGNPEWTKNGNWKDIYFFVNKDILGSEKEFCKISGCPNIIPAGTNVSNALVIMLSQSDNNARQNFFGYDKILLIGFDYSWKFNGKYYAFDDDGGGKANYMRHSYLVFPTGEFGYTSGNLQFSAQWLEQYIRAFNLPVVNCAKATLLNLKNCDLKEQMQYRFRSEDSKIARNLLAELRKIDEFKNEVQKKLSEIGKSHWDSFVCSV